MAACTIAKHIYCPGKNFTTVDGNQIREAEHSPDFQVCITRTVKSSDAGTVYDDQQKAQRVRFYGNTSERFIEFPRPVTHFFAVPDTSKERERTKRSFYGDTHFTMSLEEYVSAATAQLGSIHIYKYCKTCKKLQPTDCTAYGCPGAVSPCLD